MKLYQFLKRFLVQRIVFLDWSFENKNSFIEVFFPEMICSCDFDYLFSEFKCNLIVVFIMHLNFKLFINADFINRAMNKMKETYAVVSSSCDWRHWGCSHKMEAVVSLYAINMAWLPQGKFAFFITLKMDELSIFYCYFWLKL